jgi:hypothetical protein
MLQRVVGGVMRAEFRVEIAQNPDAHGVAHGLIVLERGRGTWRPNTYPGFSTVVPWE